MNYEVAKTCSGCGARIVKTTDGTGYMLHPEDRDVRKRKVRQ